MSEFLQMGLVFLSKFGDAIGIVSRNWARFYEISARHFIFVETLQAI